MPLDPGSRLGPYEVIAQIGVGGMGEVHRATDTNLKRQVAIKVLPEAGMDQVYLMPCPDGGHVIPVSTTGGTEPAVPAD